MQKLNVKLILILGLIATIIIAANFFIAKEREKLKRIKAEEELKLITEEKTALEGKLKQEIKEKETIKQELTQEKKWSVSLEEQLKEREKQIQLALERIEEKERIINETLAKLEEEKKRSLKLEENLQRLESNLTLLTKENKVLRGRLETEVSSLSPAVELERIVISAKPARRKEGEVILVNREYDFIVINLGINDVKEGDMVSIITDDKLIAEAQVERVEDKVCTATILPEYKQVEIKESDIARIQ